MRVDTSELPQTQESRRLLSLRGLLLGALGFVVVTGGLLLLIQTVGVDQLRATIEQAGPLAPLVYIVLKALTYIFAPLSSGPIQLSAGVLFGLWPGTIYTLIGEVAGGSISFLIARYLGRPVVRRFVGADGMARVDRFYAQIGEWRGLFYARLFLFSIYDFISYAAGFTPINLRTYVVISAIGGFIPTFAAVALGTMLTGERDSFWLLYAGIAIACLIPLLLHRQIKHKLGFAKNPSEQI